MFGILYVLSNMKKSMIFLSSSISVLVIALVAAMFVGSIPAYAGSAASSAIMQYEKGMISEEELEQRLRDIGYNEDDIRQVKAVSGGLEHQQPEYITPTESMTSIIEEEPVMKKTTNVAPEQADNFMLVLGIGGAAMVAAIAIAFSKKTLTS